MLGLLEQCHQLGAVFGLKVIAPVIENVDDHVIIQPQDRPGIERKTMLESNADASGKQDRLGLFNSHILNYKLLKLSGQWGPASAFVWQGATFGLDVFGLWQRGNHVLQWIEITAQLGWPGNLLPVPVRSRRESVRDSAVFSGRPARSGAFPPLSCRVGLSKRLSRTPALPG